MFVSRAGKWNQGGTGTRRHLCTSHSQRLCGLCPERDMELTAWGARQVYGPITTQNNRSREPQPLQRGREAQATPRDVTWLSSHSGSGRTQPRKTWCVRRLPSGPAWGEQEPRARGGGQAGPSQATWVMTAPESECWGWRGGTGGNLHYRKCEKATTNNKKSTVTNYRKCKTSP